MDDYLNYKSYSIREKVPEEKVPNIIQGMESIPGIKKFKCSGQVISFIYNPAFKMREITLGSAMKDTYVVADGLEEGEEIVTNGTFSIDAAAQLAGKTSMMNPSGTKVSTGHQHGGMEMGNESAKSENSNTKHVMVSVGGLCEMCKDRIESVAKSVSGVESAIWEIDTKMLHLNFDSSKTNSDEIQKAVAKAGHDTEKFKAPDEVYSKLPECCLYDRFKY